MFIYLDESGNLSFNFEKEGTTDYFIITVLKVKTREDNRRIFKAIERTIKNKLSRRKTRKISQDVMRGYNTIITVKKYFFNLIKDANFNILCYIIDKKKMSKYLKSDKSEENLYDFVAQKLITKCKLEEEKREIVVFLHKRKTKGAIQKFNKLLRAQTKALGIPLKIWHRHSYESKGLQAVCLFCWGIFRKAERRDSEWYVVFRNKIIFQQNYIPKKGL